MDDVPKPSHDVACTEASHEGNPLQEDGMAGVVGTEQLLARVRPDGVETDVLKRMCRQLRCCRAE